MAASLAFRAEYYLWRADWPDRASWPEPHPGGPVVISRQNSQVSTELTGTRLLGSLVWVAVEGFWRSIHRQTCSQRCGLYQLHPAVVELRQRLLQKRLLFVWQSVGYWLWASLCFRHWLDWSAVGFGPDADADDRTQSVRSTTGLALNNNGYFWCPTSD